MALVLTSGPQVRAMLLGDLHAVLAIQAEAYAGAAFVPEPAAVYADRMALASRLCLVAEGEGGAVVGYLVSHPWSRGAPPALHTCLGRLPPRADCWYLHDCAVARAAHGMGGAGALFRAGRAAALAQGLHHAALVAVGDAARYWARWCGYAVDHCSELAAKLHGYGTGASLMRCALAPAPTGL